MDNKCDELDYTQNEEGMVLKKRWFLVAYRTLSGSNGMCSCTAAFHHTKGKFFVSIAFML